MKSGIKQYQQIFRVDQENMTAKQRERLIIENAPFVKAIAERMAMRLPPNISCEELISAGIIGLVGAIEKFDSEKGIKFKAYAKLRIKGAMLDELRKMDWVPRTVRKNVRRIEDTMITLESKLDREPEDFEVAQEMGVDIDAYQKMMTGTQGIGLLRLDKIMPDGTMPNYSKLASDAPSPLDELKRKELKTVIAKALSKFTKKEQLVMSLHYNDEMTLKEIAKILNLTESRISQIHSKVIIKLRTKLASYCKG